MVAVGFGDMSKRTRFTPFTSEMILDVICCSSSKGSWGTVAVTASRVLTARMITGHSKERFPSLIPVDL